MQLDPLVKPRSVAIVGATDRGGPGRAVMESLGAIGFTGPIYPVNPKYQTVLNITCYPSLTDLPEAPDIVVFSIRNPLIPEQMRLALQRGARAAIIYDSGFAELGADGAKLQDQIAGMAREAGMPVCGPNCMGILNPPARVTTYKQNIMDPDGDRRQCRHHLAERIGLHRAVVRPAPVRHQPVGLGRQRGGDQNRRLSRLSDRRSQHQGDRDLHRDGARTGALCCRARPRRRCRQARRRDQGRAHRAHAARDHQSYRRPRRLVAGFFRAAARASRNRSQRSRRDDRGSRGLPGQALAARPRDFGHYRLGRTGRAHPRQCDRAGPRSAAARRQPSASKPKASSAASPATAIRSMPGATAITPSICRTPCRSWTRANASIPSVIAATPRTSR